MKKQEIRNFSDAARAVLKMLHKRFGYGLWMITRTEADDWIVLVTEGSTYEVNKGDVLKWSDSFCSRMARGEGPQIAPNSDHYQVYKEAPIGKQVDISSYIGIPISTADGNLFGTLCAINPEPMPESMADENEFIELQANLLGALLEMELKSQNVQRELERVQAESERDELTGLYNRRGWEKLLAMEEDRCSRYGSPSSIFMIDLDNLKTINDDEGHQQGDKSLANIAQLLLNVTRPFDVVARVGGDEFAILAVEANESLAEKLAFRINNELQENNVMASVGWATRDPRKTLTIAYKNADEMMYKQKKLKKKK